VSNKTRSVWPEGIQSTQRENYHLLLAVSEKDSRRIKTSHTSAEWEENHLIEVAIKEAMVEAMAKGKAGN